MIAEILISALLVLAGIFGLAGSWGLIRLRETMQRLHAPTKAATLGVGGVLVAAMLYGWWQEGRFSVHELLITLFLFLTAPITANFVAKAWMHLHSRPEDLPPTGGRHGWSVQDAVEEDERPIDTR